MKCPALVVLFAQFRGKVQASGIVFPLDHEEVGPIPALRQPARFSGTPANVRRASPALGQHTEEVLREAGLSDEEIASVRGQG